MPRVGFLSAQVVVTEAVSGVVGTIAQTPSNATIGVYDGTINSSAFGSVIGGFVFQLRQPTQLAWANIVGFSEGTGSIIGAQVIGFGKQLGTLYGTILGTLIPDSNWVLAKAYQTGTIAVGNQMPPKEVAAGTPILGTLWVNWGGR